MLIRTHVGVSVDGFISGPDGLPAWDSAPGWDHGTSHGYAEFNAGNDVVIVGRNTFDLGHRFWISDQMWPWSDKHVYVLTSRPLPDNTHPNVTAPEGGPHGLVEHLRAAGFAGNAQLLGGAQAIRALLEIGAVDELGIIVLPIFLGGGTPLWEAGVEPRNLQLSHQRAFPDGAVQMVYAKP
jgi:dihydrofolate reductase